MYVYINMFVDHPHATVCICDMVPFYNDHLCKRLLHDAEAHNELVEAVFQTKSPRARRRIRTIVLMFIVNNVVTIILVYRSMIG